MEGDTWAVTSSIVAVSGSVRAVASSMRDVIVSMCAVASFKQAVWALCLILNKPKSPDSTAV